MAEAPEDVRQALTEARTEGLRRIVSAESLPDLEEARVRVFGRKSAFTAARGALRHLDPDQRKELGRLANEIQTELEATIDKRQGMLAAAEQKARWGRERIDVTLPGEAVEPGALHLLTQTLWEVVDIFVGMGYRLYEGPDVEYSKLNFDALNTPYEHPSRSPLDTFYVEGKDEDVCLRSQTSPMQIRVMEASEPPVYGVFPGRVYRRDALDPTHLSQFFQMEALAVDEGITMGDLKGTLQAFARELFGGSLEVRLRPHFFPFTEPSAEMDVQCFVCGGSGCRVCKQEGWIEILGCGMVHPHLFEWVGYDSERYSGFALGMGIERIAALAHGVGDIRGLYENDTRFSAQFGGLV